MKTNAVKLIELIFLFLLLPISFLLAISIWSKLSFVIIALLYTFFIGRNVENIQFRRPNNLPWANFWKSTLLNTVIIAILTSAYVYYTDASLLFSVVRNKPLLWLFILFIYSTFSVFPQELIYRTFFLKRYESVFKNSYLLIFVNALLFSLAHLFFKNTLVLALTFLGGVVFMKSYIKNKSTLLVSIEHAIYGCWLFTVGMGDLLGFPE